MKSGHRILAVDDNATNLAIIEEILAENYDLETAESGEEAIAKAEAFRPDIILLDIMLPGMNGYEVCRRIRANPGLKHVKIIMVSAKAMVAERLQGYQAGADDYLTKPFEEHELLAKVQVYVRLKSVEEVDQLKSDVLALFNHETRTPLAGIITPAELLASADEMTLEERRNFGRIILDSAQQLHRMFEKVILLSALKAGQVRLAFEQADLGDAVRTAVNDAAARAAERRVTIETDLPGALPTWLDPAEFARALSAVLDNAVRFSPEGGTVQVRARQSEQDIELTVTDQGQGIDPSFLPQVFDELADGDILHHSQGQGLSLALTRQIILAHRGSIEVASAKEVGTIITIRLPSGPASEEPALVGASADPEASQQF